MIISIDDGRGTYHMKSFFIAISIVILVAMIVAIAVYYREKKYASFVSRHSAALKNLKLVNDRYIFYSPADYDKEHTYDNENFYNGISCEDYLIYQLRYEGKRVNETINQLHSNRQKSELYRREIDSIAKYGDFDYPIGRLKKEKLIKTERRMFYQSLQKPETEFRISVRLNCSNMNGHIYASKKETFDEVKIASMLRGLTDRRGNFFNDRNTWDAICRVERGKVSNKMRFSIYQRDGYRCCNCGKNGKITNLEIDHIVPISKGGKSTYNNLQTLCHRCNVEKGNRLDW